MNPGSVGSGIGDFLNLLLTRPPLSSGKIAEVLEIKESGEPPRNRTENPQIKSLLLCQLS
jgi:hypothetical protein